MPGFKKRCSLFILLWIITLSLPVSAEELPQPAASESYGFYTADQAAQAALLSGLSEQALAELGSRIDLFTLAPVFTLTDAQLIGYDNAPLTEEPLARQAYQAVLLDGTGNPQGYALLQYNYYTADSEHIMERTAQDDSFMDFYNEKVVNRLEITEMGPDTQKSFDLKQNLSELESLLSQTGLDKAKLQVRLVNLTESVGYAFLLTDTQNTWLMLLDNNRIREVLGLTDTKILSRSALCGKLGELSAITDEEVPLLGQSVQEQTVAIGESLQPGASPLSDGTPAPPTGGGAVPAPFHLPVLIIAGVLLAAAGGIILYTKKAVKK